MDSGGSISVVAVRADPAATAATPLIAPESQMISPLNMAQYFKRDGSPARWAWLI
jgi:hypothetical protein